MMLDTAFQALDSVRQLVSEDSNVVNVELEELPPQVTLAGTVEESKRAIVITFNDVNDSDWFDELRQMFNDMPNYKVMYGDGDTMLVLIR